MLRLDKLGLVVVERTFRNRPGALPHSRVAARHAPWRQPARAVVADASVISVPLLPSSASVRIPLPASATSRRCRCPPPATARSLPRLLPPTPLALRISLARALAHYSFSYSAGVPAGVEREGDHTRRTAAEGLRGAPAPQPPPPRRRGCPLHPGTYHKTANTQLPPALPIMCTYLTTRRRPPIPAWALKNSLAAHDTDFAFEFSGSLIDLWATEPVVRFNGTHDFDVCLERDDCIGLWICLSVSILHYVLLSSVHSEVDNLIHI